MAGDWIKMECATPDKAEVLSITAKMGWDDPDYTVGKLFRVWRWFDQHTTNGNAHGVTLALLNRIAGVSGFAESMESVGWLIVNDEGISLPGFEKHCGKTAKERAQTAKRVASHKANAKGNGDSVTGALPREEKNREEKKENINTGAEPLRDSTRAPDQAEILFNRFWEFWPRRTAKVEAQKAMKKLKPTDAQIETMRQDVASRLSCGEWRDPQYIPHPATYLNNRRWEDERPALQLVPEQPQRRLQEL